MTKVLYVAKVFEYVEEEGYDGYYRHLTENVADVKTLIVGGSREEVVSELTEYIVSKHHGKDLTRREVKAYLDDQSCFERSYFSVNEYRYTIDEVKVLNLVEAL